MKRTKQNLRRREKWAKHQPGNLSRCWSPSSREVITMPTNRMNDGFSLATLLALHVGMKRGKKWN